MRFDVILYNEVAFSRATYDEVYSKIEDYHRKRQKACGFRLDFRVDHISPGEKPPHYGGYAIVDNHEQDN